MASKNEANIGGQRTNLVSSLTKKWRILPILAVLALAPSTAKCEIIVATYQVLASADDAYAWGATEQNISSGYLMIGNDRTYTAPYYMSAMRFANVIIPRSAAIIDARLKIRSLNEGHRGQVYGVIQAESADNAVDFGSRYIDGATRTAAAINWDHKFAWDKNTWQVSPDISAIVQEVINRPGWSAGNSMAIFYSTRMDSRKSRMFASFEAAPSSAAILEVLYQTNTISGHVKTAEGVGLAGVSVSAGGGIESAVTDSGGYYEVQVPPGWSGTVAPNKTGWGFNPASRVYSNVVADQTNQDYTAFQPKISGYVKDDSGTGLEGVLVSANNSGGSDTTDSSGYYEIAVPYNWSGTVTPGKAGWGFNPSSSPYSNVTTDQLNQDFMAFEPKISGYVRDDSGTGLEAVLVSADNAGGSDITDSNGYYEITVPYRWSGQITPSKADWGFSPSSRPYYVVIADRRNQDYTAFQPKISGYIRDATHTGMEGVPVSADNGGGSAVTGADGYYVLTVPYNWSGAVTPSKAGWGFTPPSRSYSNIISDQTSQNYVPFQPRIGGYVRYTTYVRVEGVLVVADNNGGSDTTDINGDYEITVPYGWSGTVTPNKPEWGFTPSSRSYSNVVSDHGYDHYVAFQPKISGRVIDDVGMGIEGVLVTADNGGGSDTTSGSSGYYEITVRYDWSGTVTLSKSGWGFSPNSVPYSNVVADQENQDYTGIMPKISGLISDADSNPIEGVSVTTDNGGWWSDTTGADGRYEITVSYGWSGTVTASNAGWAFDPNERVYHNLTAHQASQDYTAFAPPVISGVVADTNGQALLGVLVSADNGGTSDTTDANGYYELTVPQGWSGTVTPDKAFWFFDPPSRSYANLTADALNQGYVGTAALSISGHVLNVGGLGVDGVEVSADNGGGSATTNSSGFYELGVPPGWSGSVTPSKTGRTFWPIHRSYDKLTADLTDQLYIALPLTVRIDGSGGFATIQAAVDAAFDGDVVLVGPGTYTGPGNKDINFWSKAITVRSTNPEDPCVVAATIIDCEGAGRGFYFASGEDGNSVVDGLTITNGYADNGGGIHCTSGSAPTISRCLITGNTAIISGGGVYSYWREVRITNCTIIGNSAAFGGGVVGHEGLITGCVISGNTATDSGGGLANCYGPIEWCTISGNWAGNNGGGAWQCDQLNNCMISGNFAGSNGGGGANCWSLSNCMVVGNSAGADGGGMCYVDYWHWPTVTNCTFSANVAESGNGGGIYCLCCDDGGTIANCILWGNEDTSGSGLSAQIGSNCELPEIVYSCIQDDDPNDANIPFGGTASDNIDDNPMFVRAPDDGSDGWGDDPCTPGVDEGANDDFGDLHLQSGSPCINAGRSFSEFQVQGPPQEVDLDIDGEPRVMGGTIDMGADEYCGPVIMITKPKGAEVWVAGSQHEIEWESYGYDGPVDILYSSNDGAAWTTIETGAANTGSYLWHLPGGVDSNQCVIVIVPTVPEPNITWVESGLFTIRQDTAGPAVASKWKSLGGDFDRVGLSNTSGPELGCVKWEFEVDGAISASVTIGPNETVYVPCEDGNLYTLDANGSLLWTYEANSPLISAATLGPDGTAYVGSKDGKLYAIDIDGNLRWTHTTNGMVYSSPAVSKDGNSVYVCSEDGRLYAVGRDGSELWSFETDAFGVIEGAIFASPTIADDGTVYIGGLYDANLYALDPNDGNAKWVCDFNSEGWLFASPVIGPDGTIYQTLLYDPNLYAIDPNNGNVKWATHLSEYSYNPDYPELRSYWFEPDFYESASFNVFYCETVYDLSTAWPPPTWSISDSAWSEPVVGPDGTIYVSFDDPWLRVVEPNGTIKGIFKLGSESGFDLTAGSDGLIYAASNDSNLYVVNPEGLEIARFESAKPQLHDHEWISYYYWLNLPVITADNMVVFSDSRNNSMLISYLNNKVWSIGADGCQGQELDLYWQGGPQDLNGDGVVDFHDVAIVAQDWFRCTSCRIWHDFRSCGRAHPETTFWPGDINRDRYVNFRDFALIGERWLAGY